MTRFSNAKRMSQGLKSTLFSALILLYMVSQSPKYPKYLRSPIFAIILLAILFRCYRLVLVPASGALALSLLAHTLGATIIAILLFSFILLTFLAYTHPEDGIGHRVGAEGFSGAVFENTVDALVELAAQDNRGAFDTAHFPFIEFDVQETRDGCLVLFHDKGLLRAFPLEGPNTSAMHSNAAAWDMLRHQGIDPSTATIQDLTAAQLDTLHLGGRQGVKVPTLKTFLEACIECNVRRRLAIEVKRLSTDRGREELLDLISWYKAKRGADQTGLDTLYYAPLGSAAVIAFPSQFVDSFGEFGSPQWQRWAGEFRKRGIHARCCHVHWLDYLRC